jgi:hypothetical protein
MLERVRYLDERKGIGVDAFTDGYAYDEYNRLYLLSAAGRESNVKAITSAVTCGQQVDIVGRRIVTVTRAYGEKYRILGTRLPSGLVHQVTLSEGFLDRHGSDARLLYVGEGQDIRAAVYEAVRTGFAVPLVPEWSGWLYDRLRDAEAVTELTGTARVVRLNASEDMLDDLVSEGVRSGELRF